MPVYKIDPSNRGMEVAFGNVEPFDGKKVVTLSLGPVSFLRRIKGILEPNMSVVLKDYGPEGCPDDETSTIATLRDRMVEIHNRWEEFGSPREGVIRKIPVRDINSDPDLREVLYYSPERR